MHNPFDQLAKKVGKQALDASGPTIVQLEIWRDAQHADLRHDPDPARVAEHARLGLLGRMAEVLCLIEIYGHAPDGAEVRACVGKHFAHWEEHVRKTRARNKKCQEKGLPPEADVEPVLWILAAAVSTPMLDKLQARAGLEETLADLAALPDDAHERTVAEGIVLHLQDRLARKSSRTPEEEELIVAIRGGFSEAREQGRAMEAARAVLTAFRVRGMAVPDVARERILSEKNLERLERWHELAILAASVTEVIDAPT